MTERDGTAVDVDLVHVRLVDLGPGQDDGGEGLVDLDEVDVGEAHPGGAQDPFGRGDGSVEVVVRVGADHGGGDDPGAGAQPLAGGALPAHHQDGGGPVADLGGVPGGVDAVGEYGPQGGQRLGGGVAQPLVPADECGLAGGAPGAGDGGLDVDDLSVEPALGPGPGGLLLGGEAERVRVGPGDAPVAGDALGGGELVGHVQRPALRRRGAVVGGERGAEEDAAHGLDAAADAGLDGAGGDEARDQVDGLLGRPAGAVDRGAGGGVRQPGVQPGVAGDVVGLLAGLGDAAADDLLHPAGGDAGPLQQTLLGEPEEFRRVEPGQDTPAPADRCPRGFDDDGLGHGSPWGCEGPVGPGH